MLITFVLLLVAAVSFVGLVSLWAASGHCHWFWRAAALTSLWMLLAQLRSEAPLALFAIQSLTIVGPIVALQAWQSRRRRKVAELSPDANAARASRWRFSVRDVLLATPILAGFASTYPPLTAAREGIDHVPWEFAVVGGIVFGLMTLLARTATLSWRWFVAGVIAALPVAGVISYGFEQIDPGVLEYVLDVGFEKGVFTEYWHVWVAVICGAWWGAIANQYVFIRSSRHGVVPWSRGLAAWALVLSLLPAYVYYCLITPPDIPQVALPQPNGFDDLVAAGKGLNVRLINFASESPVDQVVAELARLDEYFVLAERGLNRAHRAPVDYTGVAVNDYPACRTLARALSAKVNAAIAHDRVDDAVHNIELAFRLGLACRTGGAGIDYLVGAALEGIATSDLWKARQLLNRAQCVTLIGVLNRHAAAAEPIAVVLERHRIQTQYSYGLYGRIQTVVSDIGGATWFVDRVRTAVEPRYRATIELLKCELAIRAYQLEHGQLPASLDALVPGLLPSVPIDPFDPAGGPLRYRLDDEEYALYSVGLNGVDDAGASIVDEEEGIPSPRGDFTLDAVFGDGE
jgi:hypothetical protein